MGERSATAVEDLRRLRGEHGRLLAELQHRTRNMLALIRSIMRRTAETSETVEDYAMHLEGRLDAIIRAQAAITDHPEGGVNLDMLVANEMMAYRVREGEQLTLEGPALALRAKAVESLGLAFHELATNAIKYRALSVPHGRVSVLWRMPSDGEIRTLSIDWQESGGPSLASAPSRRGFGMEFLERTLAYELKAEVSISFDPEGLSCSIRLPLNERIVAPGRVEAY